MADGEQPPALPHGDGGGGSTGGKEGKGAEPSAPLSPAGVPKSPVPATKRKEPLPRRATITQSAISQQRGAGEGATGPARPPGDSAVELIISWLLRIGVWSSITIIVFGFALLIV